MLLALVGSSAAFSISNGPKEINVKLGEPIKVIFTVDNWYEWCTFTHLEQSCEIEWKRSPYNVTMGSCDYIDRGAEFRGDYNKYTCGLMIPAATAEDQGEWSVNFESYVNGGSRGDGNKRSKKYVVNVELPTTTTTTTTTTPTTTTSTTTVRTTTSTTPEVEVPEMVAEPVDESSEAQEEVEDVKKSEGQVGDIVEEGHIVPIVIAICLLIIAGGLSALFGLHYKRKLHPCFYRMFSPRWKPVNTDMDVDDEKHPTIIKNGGADLNVSELGPMGDGANINGDLTAVTFVGEKEEEDVKKELNDAQEEEKKDDAPEKEKEEVENEDTPLKKDDDEDEKKKEEE